MCLTVDMVKLWVVFFSLFLSYVLQETEAKEADVKKSVYSCCNLSDNSN